MKLQNIDLSKNISCQLRWDDSDICELGDLVMLANVKKNCCLYDLG